MSSSDVEMNFVNCDAVALNIFEGITQARNLVGITDGGLTLEEHLSLSLIHI